MKWVESAGLVKFDFLGLKTLTVIQRAVRFLERRGARVDIDRLPLDDQAAYGLLAAGQTVGVFQMEGQGMRDTLRKLRPASTGRDHRADLPLPARPDGFDRRICRLQDGAAAGKDPGGARGRPRRDLWGHRLPGTGDADRPDTGGLFLG